MNHLTALHAFSSPTRLKGPPTPPPATSRQRRQALTEALRAYTPALSVWVGASEGGGWECVRAGWLVASVLRCCVPSFVCAFVSAFVCSCLVRACALSWVEILLHYDNIMKSVVRRPSQRFLPHFCVARSGELASPPSGAPFALRSHYSVGWYTQCTRAPASAGSGSAFSNVRGR